MKNEKQNEKNFNDSLQQAKQLTNLNQTLEFNLNQSNKRMNETYLIQNQLEIKNENLNEKNQ